MFRQTREKIIAGDNYLKISSLRYLPRWMIFLMDIFILFVSLVFSYFIMKNMVQMPDLMHSFWLFSSVIGVNAVFMYFLKTFAGIIRHSSIVDFHKIFLSTLFSVFFFVVGQIFNFLDYRNQTFLHCIAFAVFCDFFYHADDF